MSNEMMFADMDALLSAQMDDIEDLPPVGVPPTGHYNLEVTCEKKLNKEKTGSYFQFNYEVTAVNAVKNPEEQDQAAEGMKFSDRFSPFKKDGSVNDFGVKFLKEAVKPFAEHFGTSNMGEALAAVNKVAITAELVRIPNAKDEERPNFRLKNVVIL